MKFETYGEPLEKEPIKFIAEIDSVGTTRDGGARITIDVGADSLDAIQSL